MVKWSNDNLYGIDKDDIGVKLTRAEMVAVRDGSTHVLLGDAVRVNEWAKSYTKLSDGNYSPRMRRSRAERLGHGGGDGVADGGEGAPAVAAAGFHNGAEGRVGLGAPLGAEPVRYFAEDH